MAANGLPTLESMAFLEDTEIPSQPKELKTRGGPETEGITVSAQMTGSFIRPAVTYVILLRVCR